MTSLCLYRKLTEESSAQLQQQKEEYEKVIHDNLVLRQELENVREHNNELVQEIGMQKQAQLQNQTSKIK